MRTKRYIKCSVCKTADYPFMARDMCSSCYAKEYKKDPDANAKIASQKRAWYIKHRDHALSVYKKNREERHFNGQRELALSRDNFRCTRCKQARRLIVHHIDGNGRGSKRPNNKLSNLVTLCRRCHLIEHRHETIAARKERHNARWSKWAFECKGCGLRDNKHYGLGYCVKCYYPKVSKPRRHSLASRVTVRELSETDNS